MLAEGFTLGVVCKVVLRTPHIPNRVHKTMALWFDAGCCAAYQALQASIRRVGRLHADSVAAAREYKGHCLRAKGVFAATLPEQLKYAPKQFWSWVHAPQHTMAAVDPTVFADHCNQLYAARAHSIAQPMPAPGAVFPPFTTCEVAAALHNGFKGNVSSGMCHVPSQLVKHLGTGATAPLAAFITQCT